MRGLVKRILVGVAVLPLLAWWGCGAPNNEIPEETGDGGTVVVTTIFPLADIGHSIGGDRVDVINLLPGGASPHTFEPAPRQMQRMAGAEVVVQVGAGLDDWADKLSGVVPAEAVRVRVTEGMHLRAAGRHAEDREHPVAHGHGETAPEVDGEAVAHRHYQGDPHVWLDPVLVRDEIAPRICAALCVAAPADAAYFKANLESFQAELARLDEELSALTAGLDNKHFVAYHSAWGYFADRYGLVEVATVEDAPGKEPSPAWIARVVDLARHHGAGAIFAEPQFSTKAAEVIADEYGARVLILDPLGGEDLPGRDSYLGLMRYNARVLAEGLGTGN
ncbi:MAG: zinc ABC transporter substrate-binding protein [Candidatus Desulforudis sp.]|nr:zinc ABC transporter substrate-binding protein [Desulforudis sp.]